MQSQNVHINGLPNGHINGYHQNAYLNGHIPDSTTQGAKIHPAPQPHHPIPLISPAASDSDFSPSCLPPPHPPSTSPCMYEAKASDEENWASPEPTAHTTAILAELNRTDDGDVDPSVDGIDDTTLPSASTAPTAFGSAPSSPVQIPAQRHIARKALQSVGDKAAALISSTKSRSVVMKFGIETTCSVVTKFIPNTAKSFTVNNWQAYGDPFLNKIDQKIDEACNAIEYAAQQTGLGVQPSPMQRAMSDPVHLPRGLEEHIHSDDDDDRPEDNMQLLAIDRHPNSMYTLYWERLKERFVHSQWYARVDEILQSNRMVQALNTRMIRPAEYFYTTVTEEFVTNANWDDFLLALKTKLGEAWDDRLTPLAKGFYTTAKAVSALVSAPRFFGGALQLGKAKVNSAVHNAIDDLLVRWDQVLGVTDTLVDTWLPERNDTLLLNEQKDSIEQHLSEDTDGEESSGHSAAEEEEHIFTMDMEGQTQGKKPVNGTRHPRRYKRHRHHHHQHIYTSSDDETPTLQQQSANRKKRSCEHLAALDQEMELEPTLSNNSVKSLALATKFGKRLKQRIPSIPHIPTVRAVSNYAYECGDDLRLKLTESSWFTRVDEILLQNTLIKTLATFIRPAEHFYNTALQLFSARVREQAHEQPLLVAGDEQKTSDSEHKSSPSTATPPTSPQLDDFISTLRRSLGASWDERLVQPAGNFYQTAVQVGRRKIGI